MSVEIFGDDIISRCIIFDRSFNHDVHVDEYLFRFEGGERDGAYHESGVLRRLAPNDDDVHQIGCATAETQNERKKLPRGPTRRYYCGFRSVQYDSLPTSGENYDILIANIPENGSDAHVDIAVRINLPRTKEYTNARASARTKAGLALAVEFGHATAHRCADDVGDRYHPFDRFGIECLNRRVDLDDAIGEEPDVVRSSIDG